MPSSRMLSEYQYCILIAPYIYESSESILKLHAILMNIDYAVAKFFDGDFKTHCDG